MTCVLDASAVIAFLMQEPGADVVEAHLNAGGCIIHAINVCEVLYTLRRDRTPEEAQENVQRLLDVFGAATRNDVDLPFLRIVADYKTAPTSTPLGDCFGLALAHREGLPFVTSYRGDMERVAARGTVAIEFVR